MELPHVYHKHQRRALIGCRLLCSQRYGYDGNRKRGFNCTRATDPLRRLGILEEPYPFVRPFALLLYIMSHRTLSGVPM